MSDRCPPQPARTEGTHQPRTAHRAAACCCRCGGWGLYRGCTAAGRSPRQPRHAHAPVVRRPLVDGLLPLNFLRDSAVSGYGEIAGHATLSRRAMRPAPAPEPNGGKNATASASKKMRSVCRFAVRMNEYSWTADVQECWQLTAPSEKMRLSPVASWKGSSHVWAGKRRNGCVLGVSDAFLSVMYADEPTRILQSWNGATAECTHGLTQTPRVLDKGAGACADANADSGDDAQSSCSSGRSARTSAKPTKDSPLRAYLRRAPRWSGARGCRGGRCRPPGSTPTACHSDPRVGPERGGACDAPRSARAGGAIAQPTCTALVVPAVKYGLHRT
jgi:hypothetical protein